MNPRWTHVRPRETMLHYMSSSCIKKNKNRLLSCRLHTVLLIFSDLTTWAQCVQFLSVILPISSGFHVPHLWTSLLSISAHAWVECGTAPTTAAQVCAFPLWVVEFKHSNSMLMVGDHFITAQRC